jgi:peroxiredoxin
VSAPAPGMPAPEFTLEQEDGSAFTRADLLGSTTVLVFYPFTFCPVCTDQLQLYEEVLDEVTAQGARLFGVSCDAPYAQTAFRKSLNVTIPQLSDFEPKGAASRAFGAYFEPGGMSSRALVVTDAEGVVRWRFDGEHPGVLPGADLLFDGLAAARY